MIFTLGDRIFGALLKCLSNMFVDDIMKEHFLHSSDCKNVFEDMITTGHGN